MFNKYDELLVKLTKKATPLNAQVARLVIVLPSSESESIIPAPSPAGLQLPFPFPTGLSSRLGRSSPDRAATFDHGANQDCILILLLHNNQSERFKKMTCS